MGGCGGAGGHPKGLQLICGGTAQGGDAGSGRTRLCEIGAYACCMMVLLYYACYMGNFCVLQPIFMVLLLIYPVCYYK